ncbi:DUF5691 domain-containing protein [Nocardiopsis sp. NPDC055551]
MNQEPSTPEHEADASDPRGNTGTDWGRLVSAALVGTARRTVPTPPGLPERSENATALLDLAVVETVRAKAGYIAHTATPIDPDPSDPLPEIGVAETHRLDVILAGRPELLAEWLDLLVRSGRCVPRARIPDLLDRAARDRKLRPAVAAAVGTRGVWLAGLNKPWSFITAEPMPGDTFDQEVWDQGTTERRRRALSALRAQDPAAGRDLVRKAWPNESRGEVRRDLLETLEPTLEPEDEPLLDQALDDGNASVRGRALSLLVGLPDGAHAHRLRGYLRRRLRVVPDAPNPVHLENVDPDEPELLRDLALVAAKTRSRVKDPRPQDEHRERHQVLITHTPPDVWTELLDTTPDGVLTRVAEDDLLREAIIDAVGLRGDATWARAVLDHPTVGLSRMVGGSVHDLQRQRIRQLLAPLPVDERCERIRAVIGRTKGKITLCQVLTALPTPWTRELSAAVVEVLSRSTDRRSPTDTHAHQRLCVIAAESMPPEHLDLLPESSPNEEEAHEYLRLRDTLRFRLDMHKELS